MSQAQDPLIHSIFIGQPKTITDERGTWRSSIYREPAHGPVQAQTGGLVGDKVTQPYHGGPDSAICVHLFDHYRFWNEHYGLDLKPGSVGENFTLDHITEDQVCAGDIVRVGTALVQVSGPRVPCANQARRIGRADWVKLTIAENRTGFYLRVLEPGMIQPRTGWNLQERVNPDGSIPALNRCMYLHFDSIYAHRISQMQGLGEWWKDQVREKQEQRGDHWTATMRD
jgi:MOSC domain-containing protein YiiM